MEYICLSEDMAMKTGPLLSPRLYRQFILPRLKRVIEFYKTHGVRYVAVDTDGNPEALIPMLMDAGVDIIWPLERAADQDPVQLRKKFGRTLRLWGGVDKRVLTQGPAAIDTHLREFVPLIEEGGFIPTVDHTVPPDVSWEHFRFNSPPLTTVSQNLPLIRRFRQIAGGFYYQTLRSANSWVCSILRWILFPDRGRETYRRLEGEDMTPIVVYKSGNRYYIGDRNSRLAVARYLGKAFILAEVRELPWSAAPRP